MTAFQPSITFFVIIAILSAIEFRWRIATGRGYDFGAFGGTIGVMIGQILIKGLVAGGIGVVMLGVYALAPIQLPLDDWRTWLVGFFVLEFFYYWQHRFSHTIRWFWASHSVHHSSNEFALPAAVRLSWTGGITGVWIVYLPMILFGFHPLVVVTLLMANLQYQYFIHTEAVGRFGPLEWVLNTPSHHRVHHGSNPDYLDKNFGGVLIVFDRLFGTFEAERSEEPVIYGLTKPLKSNNPFVIAFHEWGNMINDLRGSRSASAVLRALFGRPGASTPKSNSLDLRSAPPAPVEEMGSDEIPPPSVAA